MAENFCAKIDEAAAAFQFEGTPQEHHPYGSGHINDTFLLTTDDGGRVHRYILQRMNHLIFQNPLQVMENVTGVTSFLRGQILKNGGDPLRETLTVIPTKDGKSCFVDSIGSYWRAYLFIEDAFCLDLVEKPDDFYQSAVAFGNFQHLLADYPAATLHETIPNFHNTAVRFETFRRAVAADKCGRAKDVQPEIEFALARAEEASTLVDLLAKGELPLRVTHNDTKLNNVMLDRKTGKGICVIDLDTVMPGLALYDFGDSIRFGASTALEDEPDLSKVEMSLALFELYAKGYIEASGGSLTALELELMPMGAKMMTFECGIRFLTDHLEGDTYFKIHREGHNLDRARTQFKLVADMEHKWPHMQTAVARCTK